MLKKILIFIVVLVIIAAFIGFYFKGVILDPNVSEDKDGYELYIVPGSSFEQVVGQLEADQVLKDVKSFELVASLMNYKKGEVPSGRYIIKGGWSNRALIGKLRLGAQDGVKVTYNNLRTIEELAGKLSRNILLDSVSILEELSDDDFLQRNNRTIDNVMSLFIPNTYEVYWDVNTDELLTRLIQEQSAFWTDSRRAQLQELSMTEEEVYILASIVEKESNLKSERPTVAGVYLNRIRQEIPLQADPTVVFAHGDFGIRRVLNRHLEIDSPYNTYKNTGLPPGPICMPSINSIDAVLKNEEHPYLFFCAKPGYNAGHLFAKTNAQHAANARKYHRWLSSQNIR